MSPFSEFWPCLCLCVGVLTCNGLLYLQLDPKLILGGAAQEKQHNGLDKKHPDKHLNVTSRSVTAESSSVSSYVEWKASLKKLGVSWFTWLQIPKRNSFGC